jgi:hypothetical protein
VHSFVQQKHEGVEGDRRQYNTDSAQEVAQPIRLQLAVTRHCQRGAGHPHGDDHGQFDQAFTGVEGAQRGELLLDAAQNNRSRLLPGERLRNGRFHVVSFRACAPTRAFPSPRNREHEPRQRRPGQQIHQHMLPRRQRRVQDDQHPQPNRQP